MNKYLRYTVVLFLCTSLSLVFTGCEDFLSPEPTTFFDDTRAFETIDDAEAVLLGAYAYLPSHIGALIRREGVIADDTALEPNTGGGYENLHNWTWDPSLSDIEGMFTTPYVVTYRLNTLIENIDLVEGDQTKKDQLLGEAYALRGLAHFNLVKVFGDNYAMGSQYGVPYITDTEIKEPARNSVQEVYNNILADFATAKGLMTNTYADDVTHISPEAVTALESRVYLYMENWGNAESSATEAINSGLGLSDASSYASMYSYPNEADGENLFKIPVSATGYAVSSSWWSVSTGIINNYAPSNGLKDSYEAGDVRSGVVTAVQSGASVVGKYLGDPSTSETAGIGDLPVIRMSEVYLNRAEARFNNANEAGAREDLDMVRAARIPGYVSLGETGGALRNAIYDERRKELAFEGHRFFDLKRWGYAIDRATTNDCQISPACELAAGDYKFTFPVPTHEILANDNMTQYPGY